MKSIRRVVFGTSVFALLAVLANCGALAQEDVVPPEKKAESAPVDPTQPSPKLKDALTPPAVPNVATLRVAHKFPEMTLRALILTEKKSAVAIIDVKGRNYTVSPGSILSVAVDDGVTKLAVKNISKDGVTIELSGTSETLTLK